MSEKLRESGEYKPIGDQILNQDERGHEDMESSQIWISWGVFLMMLSPAIKLAFDSWLGWECFGAMSCGGGLALGFGLWGVYEARSKIDGVSGPIEHARELGVVDMFREDD